MSDVVPSPAADAAQAFRALLSKLKDAEELVQIGAYVAGADEELDRALQKRGRGRFLRDGRQGPTPPDQTVSLMTQILRIADAQPGPKLKRLVDIEPVKGTSRPRRSMTVASRAAAVEARDEATRAIEELTAGVTIFPADLETGQVVAFRAKQVDRPPTILRSAATARPRRRGARPGPEARGARRQRGPRALAADRAA